MATKSKQKQTTAILAATAFALLMIAMPYQTTHALEYKEIESTSIKLSEKETQVFPIDNGIVKINISDDDGFDGIGTSPGVKTHPESGDDVYSCDDPAYRFTYGCLPRPAEEIASPYDPAGCEEVGGRIC